MALEIDNQPVPLLLDAEGVVRVTGSRVTLDVIVSAFGQGATAEEICQRYPSVSLPDVYAVIAFFLRHPHEVEDYLRVRARVAREVRGESEMRFKPDGIRERLLARRRP